MLNTVKPRYIATNRKREFGRITSLAIDRGLDFCQLHVDIVRHACAIGEKKAFSRDLTIPYQNLSYFAL